MYEFTHFIAVNIPVQKSTINYTLYNTYYKIYVYYKFQ